MSRPPGRSHSGGRKRLDGTEGDPPGEWLYGLNPVREALASGRREIHELRVRTDRGGDRELVGILETVSARGIPISIRKDAGLGGARPADAANAQGVALRVGPLPERSLEELLAEGPKGHRTLVALDRVEDPQNLGAIFRVAEAAGVHGLVLTRRRAPPLTAAVARASAGAAEWVPVARVANLTRALDTLKSAGFWVFGAVLDDAEDLYALPERALEGDRVVVLGAEGAGIRPGVASALDYRVEIPMHGKVASLNVSTAAAVVLFEIRRRRAVATLL